MLHEAESLIGYRLHQRVVGGCAVFANSPTTTYQAATREVPHSWVADVLSVDEEYRWPAHGWTLPCCDQPTKMTSIDPPV